MLFKKGVHRNSVKFTGKHPCQSLFFNKFAGLRPATLLEKSFWHRFFPVNFTKFLRIPFFTEHLGCLLLNPFITKPLNIIFQNCLNMAFSQKIRKRETLFQFQRKFVNNYHPVSLYAQKI